MTEQPRERIFDILSLGAIANPAGIAVHPLSGSQITFTTLLTTVEILADEMRSLGAKAGDRIAIVCESGVAGVALLFAASLCDCVCIPVNARLTVPELAHIGREAAPNLIFYALGNSPLAQMHAKAAGATIFPSACLADVAVLQMNDGAELERETFAEGTALVLFTSGTTGVPKGVMHGARAITNVAASDRQFRNIRPADRVYCALPITHMFGLTGLLMPYLSGGATVELGTFDADTVLQRLASGQVTHFFGVPTMYTALLESAERTGVKPRNVLCARTGGSSLDATLAERAADLFGVPLANGYGATEISPICTTGGQSGVTVGKPAAGAEVRIVSPDGAALPEGHRGEIWVRGPHRMLGYYKAKAATEAVLRDGGWYITGDIGCIDARGDLVIVGRCKDVINRSGFNVYPAEIETALATHEAVARCAVIGIPTSDNNEQVVAIVQPREGCALTTDLLSAHVRELLTGYKRPNRYVFVRSLPVGPTGKVVKAELFALAKADSPS